MDMLYSNGVWLGVDLRMDTQNHVFKRNWIENAKLLGNLGGEDWPLDDHL